jgi:hypothetical protein
MAVFKRKEEQNDTMMVRVPASLKREFTEIRERADAQGLDFGATITDALSKLAKQMREELENLQRKSNGSAKPAKQDSMRAEGELSQANGRGGHEVQG